MHIYEQIGTSVLQAISPTQAWHYGILPYKIEHGVLHLFVRQNVDSSVMDELPIVLGMPIHATPTDSERLNQKLSQYYRQPTETAVDTRETSSFNIKDKERLLKGLLREAEELGSSDIHLEPYEKMARIRFRLDGKLVEKYEIEKKDYPVIVNQIKIQANLDIAEKRLPQDGRIFMETSGSKVDLRVSVLPGLHGEKIVLRLLHRNSGNLSLDSLGMEATEKQRYLEAVSKPNGMVLISGPTGSGKTTTLFGTLKFLNSPERNILTIENPIEYTLEGVNQVQLRENIGLDFPKALRTFLRQDPDIIMVGEIRDTETATMAVRASLTGHLVLSTIHTNSAWGIAARLLNMGTPAYLLADTLNALVAQRLVRKLCVKCKEVTSFNNSLFPSSYKNDIPVKEHHIAKGCPSCHYSGYTGRKAVYEVISIDRELADAIRENKSNVREILKKRGFASLSDNAFRLLLDGTTSIQEIYPILSASE